MITLYGIKAWDAAQNWHFSLYINDLMVILL
jgi:hypothetical protein